MQEDNAPGHKGYAKAYRGLNGMETLEWPAESPDLNLIEACWGDVETELGEIWERAADVEALQLYLAVLGSGYYRGEVRCIGRGHACEIASCHRCWRSGDEILSGRAVGEARLFSHTTYVVITTHSFNCIWLSTLLI